MTSISIKISGMEAVEANMSAAPEIITAAVKEGIGDLAKEAETGEKQRAPVDMSILRDSIHTTYSDDGLTSYTGPTEPNTDDKTNIVAIVMELGRLPGSPMPPEGSMDGWESRHGIDPSQDYAIRRAIGIHGIAPHYYVKDTFEEIEPHAQQTIQEAVNAAVKNI
jgi:hypothetical protein